MEIILAEANIAIADLPGVPGGKVLIFITKQGITVKAPLTEQACQLIAAQLRTGIIVASGPLPPVDGARRA